MERIEIGAKGDGAAAGALRRSSSSLKRRYLISKNYGKQLTNDDRHV